MQMQTETEIAYEQFRNDIEPELAARRPRVIEEDEPGCFLNSRPPVKRSKLKPWRKSGQMRLTRIALGKTSES
jgi:hypothetical protein